MRGMARSRKRKALYAGVWLLVGLALIVLTFPIWFPWVLRPVAASRGASYAGYARDGYSRFALKDLTFTNSTTIFRAGRVGGLLPTAWLWARYVSDTKGAYVNVENWTLVLRKANAKRGIAASVIETFDQTAEAITTLRKWLPRAALTNGVLEL